jgi:endonuclease/exonuclease/phosphatase family metal-dependent hydrolase
MKKMFFLMLAIAVSQTTQAQDVKLMTYNLRLALASDGLNSWEHRKDFMVDQLNFYAPDIFGTQEGLPNQIEYLNKELKGYQSIGQGREGGSKGEHVAVFYNTNRFQVLVHHTFWLSDTPDRVSKGWDAAYLRICTYGLFYDKETHESFWVFNTHLDNHGKLARKNGVALVLKKIDEINSAHIPVILMGDLNSTPESDVIQEIGKQFNPSKALSETKPFGPDATFNGFQWGVKPANRIDYIFIRKGAPIAVKKYAVLRNSRDRRFPSDHFPVFIEVAFTNIDK